MGKVTDRVFMDIEIDGNHTGRIVYGLFGDIAPRTTENFKRLCACDAGIGTSGKELCYKGSKFHRISRDYYAHGGDITHNDGRGGEGIYGRYFDDEEEALKLTHTRPHLLGMANKG